MENAERILAAVQVLESLAYVDSNKLCMYGHSSGQTRPREGHAKVV